MYKEKKNIIFKLLLVLVFFNVLFPKAGFKISGIPITISNIIFFLTFIIWLLYSAKNKKIKSTKVLLSLVLSIIYFILKYILIYARTNIIVEYITYIIPLIVYPLIYFVIIDQVDRKEKLNDIVKIIYYGFILICTYSLIQFFFGIEKTAIPGLTVNYSDYKTMGSTWFLQKSNGVDIANSKIVSTYQNGNLLGINLILIYPMIYMLLKKEKKNKQLILSLLLFIVCGFLTLSRTCWLGIVLFIIFIIFFEKNKKTKSNLMFKLLIILLSFMSIVIVFKYMPSVANRFFNTKSSDWINMSGRTEGLVNVFNAVKNSNSVLAYIIGPEGIINYSGLAYEILPLSLFAQTGLLGILFLYSVFFKALKRIGNNNPISKGIKVSIIIWLIIGCIECGYWLPPTAMNVFILLALGQLATQINKGEC